MLVVYANDNDVLVVFNTNYERKNGQKKIYPVKQTKRGSSTNWNLCYENKVKYLEYVGTKSIFIPKKWGVY